MKILLSVAKKLEKTISKNHLDLGDTTSLEKINIEGALRFGRHNTQNKYVQLFWPVTHITCVFHPIVIFKYVDFLNLWKNIFEKTNKNKGYKINFFPM